MTNTLKTEISGTRIGDDGRAVAVTIDGLERINVLFGKNGTGKSSFMRNLYQNDAENYHLIVPERGGIDMKHNSGILDQENDVTQKKKSRTRNFDADYRNRAMSRATGILTADGYNNMHGIESHGVSAEEITSLFGIILPEFKVIFSEENPHNLQIYKVNDSGEQIVTSTDQLSSGQSEALSLAADIITQGIFWNDKGRTLLIDEPDAHLHVDLENRFAIFINEIAETFNIQIIIATHSPGLIASLLSITEDVSVICFDGKKERISAVKKDESAIFTNLLSAELSLAVVLKRKIVIVEGNDDFLVWNQATRTQSFSDLSLIQASGSDILKYKKNAEAIMLAVLDDHTKYGVVILDGDGKNDYTNKPEDILPCERLNCYSLENLLLTNEVLAKIRAGIDLPVELEALKIAEGTTDDEKTELDNIITDKQSTKISKELIKKIHSHIDQHASVRDWRILLGKVLGAERPSGELLSFLGEELTNYIWGALPENSESNVDEADTERELIKFD